MEEVAEEEAKNTEDKAAERRTQKPAATQEKAETSTRRTTGSKYTVVKKAEV